MTAIVTKHFPIHILGGGSIGLLFASYIRRSIPSYPITVLLRPRGGVTCNKTTTNEGNINRSPWNGRPCQIFVSLRTPPNCDHLSLTGQKSKEKESEELVQIPAMEIMPPSITSSSSSETPQDNKGKIKNLILCTKAPDAVSALQSILPTLHPECTIVVLTNGQLAVRDEVCGLLLQQQHQQLNIEGNTTAGDGDEAKEAELFLSGGERIGTKRIILASTTHGAKRTISKQQQQEDMSSSDNSGHHIHYHIQHAGGGPTSVHDPHLAKLFQMIGLGGTYVPSLFQMKHELWKKLAVNCVINPFTALLNCKNGELLLFMKNEDDYKEIEKAESLSCHQDSSGQLLSNINRDYIRGILKEVSAVANAELLALLSSAGNDKEQNNGNIDNNNEVKNGSIMGYDELQNFVRQVMVDTKDNTSSMLQDVNAGRHPTEIQYINGYVCKVAKSHNISCKINQELCSMVNALSQGKN